MGTRTLKCGGSLAPVAAWTALFVLSALGAASAQAPANDNFPGTPLGAAPVSTTGTSVGATMQPGEPVPYARTGTHSVWWTWTAPSSGLLITVDTYGTPFDTVLGVYTGTDVGFLATVAEADDTIGAQSEVKFVSTAGTDYRIVVNGFQASSVGSIQLNLSSSALPAGPELIVTSIAPAPAPTELGNPADFTVTVLNQGTAAAGAFQVGFFRHSGVPFISSIPDQSQSVAGLAAGATTTLTFPVTPSGIGNFVARAYVDNLGSMSQVAESIEGNNASGPFPWSVVYPPSPPNDDFPGTTLTGDPVSGFSWNIGATAEVGEPNPAGVSGTTSVWWTWTAVTSGTTTIYAFTLHDSTLGVYTGSAVNALTLIAENDDYPRGIVGSKVTFFATAGTTYRIQMNGKGGATGDLGLNIQGSTTPFQRDLAITSLSHTPEPAVAGQVVTFSVTVTNQGSVNTGLFQVGFFQDRALAPDIAAIPDSTQDVPDLAPGANTTLTFTRVAPGSGSFVAWAYADDFDGMSEVDESDESDNASAGDSWTGVAGSSSGGGGRCGGTGIEPIVPLAVLGLARSFRRRSKLRRR